MNRIEKKKQLKIRVIRIKLNANRSNATCDVHGMNQQQMGNDNYKSIENDKNKSKTNKKKINK